MISGSTTTATGNSDALAIRLHVLKLHESPVINDNDYSRFRWTWLIDDSVPPKTSTDNNDSTGSDYKITHGDVLFFPELQTGAGEFEGLRFAGQRQQQNDNDNHDVVASTIPLLVPGVESLIFPFEIDKFVSNHERGPFSLRDMYGRPIESLFRLGDISGADALADIYGGDEVVEEMWNKPDVLRPLRNNRNNDQEKDGVTPKWIIPLSKCTLVRSECFQVITSTRS